MRFRTTFYLALGRLLMVDLGEDEEKFEQFMVPITSASLKLTHQGRVPQSPIRLIQD